MSETSELIASEIADFFTGFGGPGEPDIQTGEAQRLLTERLVSVLALRERAEPVAYIFKHPVGKLFWALTDESNKDHADVMPVYAAPPAPSHENVHYADAAEAEIAALRKRIADLEASPPAPVVPDAIPETESKDGNDIDYMEPSAIYELGKTHGWNACRAAMLAAPGKER
nr:hypothetical protein [Cronobacter sakazakii]